MDYKFRYEIISCDFVVNGRDTVTGQLPDAVNITEVLQKTKEATGSFTPISLY